jgi:ABC-type multidrug transport system ATPase subunit
MKTPLIVISHLSVQSRERTLLEDVSLEIYAGEITLLVGRSGSGKTVLMKILSGLITPSTPPFTISGSIRLEGREILSGFWRRRVAPVGIVFQDYGLMDNYSLLQNLEFAFAHSPFQIPGEQRKNIALRLQQKLELDLSLPIRHASGGQKRRIAIARTLAYNPEIIIYDEPTSGLDTHMGRKVAQLIRSTHEVFAKKSTLVVTHQYEDFLPLVDRVLFLDPGARTIREVATHELTQLTQKEDIGETPSQPGKGKWAQLGERCAGFFAGTTSWCWRGFFFLFVALLRLLPYWHSPLWGMRFYAHYLRMVSFLSAILYIGMSGIIIGFVGAYFTFKFLPYSQFTKPLITEDILAALGYGFYRIIIPILTSVLVAARCGAAVTSDVGNRVYLQEIDAMRSLGASPSCYLQTGIIYAFLVGLPLLTLLAFFLARTVCLWVFLFMHPQYNAVLADAIFHSFLREGGMTFFKGTHWVMAKELVCGLGLANICYWMGLRSKSSTRDISKDITLAVIWGTLFVLLTHLVFALLEF